MSDVYRIFGAELSPYSVKVRSYFRFKGIPHQWIPRGPKTQEEFSKYAKLPLIPLVVTPQSEGIQDSTPIIEKIETLFPEPTIYPEDPALRFISALLEEYADEWGNKHMFHYRWFYEPDQRSAAERIARMNLPADATVDMVAKAVANVRERMVPRLSFVGSSPETKDQIETSFRRLLGMIEDHLASRPYLLGDRPALADFGMYAQLYQCLTDPTPGAILRQEAPRTTAWIDRMLDPSRDQAAPRAKFEAWSSLRSTLEPVLRREVGAVFLPWTLANAAALQSGADTVTVDLEGRAFRQGPQKYHARSLAALRDKYKATANRAELDQILRSTGCLDAIAA
jgi:glutathione S-transferase